jgi:ubiquinone/menaquinone biosynthesis C-methylase UbiE
MKNPNGHPIVAATLDFAMRGLARVRKKVVPRAEGDVLELGLGTGLNLGSYEGIRSLTAVEPDPHMVKRARKRADDLGVDVKLDEVSAHELPYTAGSFDTVVATFVLCTIPDPVRALEEARRVLRPDGQLLFAEHVRSSYPLPRWIQNTIDPLWGHFAGGCHVNRDALALIAEAGFEAEHRTHGGQRFTISPIISGVARVSSR